ncbi:MAG: hypothetical protein HQ488_00115 [Parcubacteria group bacterium]|nr:hypothetical protein [Parcubacteria group bacterium]
MKSTCCLICQSTSSSELLVNYQDPFARKMGIKETRYVICTPCGFVYQNPMLSEEIEKLYTEDYYEEKDWRAFDQYALKKGGVRQADIRLDINTRKCD